MVDTLILIFGFFAPGIIALALVYFISIRVNGLYIPALVGGIVAATLPILAEYSFSKSTGVPMSFITLFSTCAIYFSIVYAAVKGIARLTKNRIKK